jgi:hypothetical protein
VPHEDPVLRLLCEGRPPWEQVTIVAGRQGQAISTAQLDACEVSPKAIRTATGRHQLHRLHRGVYAVGTKNLPTLGRNWAAHLAAGADSALNDLTAGAVYALHPWSGTVHVAAPTHRRDHRGVRVHHVDSLDPSMVTRRQRLPIVKPAHVLLELAARLGPEPLTLAVNEALARRLVRVPQLEVAMTARHGHHGVGRLSATVASILEDPGRGRTHGELEALAFSKLRAVEGLPPYERNVLVQLAGGRIAKPDLYFRELRVMVELDSRTWHEQRDAMDSDRRRDQQALAVGLVTFRITWRHVVREWNVVLADLLDVLDRASRNVRLRQAS